MSEDIKDDTLIMIDPPSGWLYGFPKEILYSDLKNLEKILIDNGYPKEDIEFASKYLRYWISPSEDDND